jgi:hypothetical protein
MAICDDYPGLKVEVLVDSRPLTEYDDDEATPRTISKYIEGRSGKEFALRITFAHPFPTKYGVETRVSIDGGKPRILSREPTKLYNPEGHYKLGVGFQKDGQ